MGFLDALTGLRAGWQVETLIAALVRASVMLVACAVLARWSGRREDARHHALWSVALGLVILAPLVSPAFPALDVDVRDTALARLSIQRSGAGLSSWILLVWLAGAALLGARTIVGVRRLARVRREAEPCDDARARRLARRAGNALGLRDLPSIVLSSRFALPVSFGAVRPTVVLPASALTWSDARLDCVLRHELVHVLRRDWLWQMLGRFACTVHWFNPIVWYALRRQRLAAELACDRRVVAAGADAIAYASELVTLASRVTGTTPEPLGALSFVRQDDLERRVDSLVAAPRRSVPASRYRTVISHAGLIALLGILLAMRPAFDPCGLVPASLRVSTR